MNLSSQTRLPTREQWQRARDRAGPAPKRPAPLWATPPAPEAGPEAEAEREADDPASAAPAVTPGPPTFAGKPMASWGYRVGASAVDYGLAIFAGAAVAGVVVLAGGATAVASATGSIAGLGFLLVDWVIIAGLSNGQTLGRRLAAIRVVRESGQRYGVGTASLRDVLCKLIYLVPLMWLVDVLVALGPERQTLRDRMVRTRVLTESAYRARRWPLTAAALLMSAAWIGAFIAFVGLPDSGGHYSAQDRQVFIDGCDNNGISDARCGCAFDYIRLALRYDEYQQAAGQDFKDWSPSVKHTIDDAFATCR